MGKLLWFVVVFVLGAGAVAHSGAGTPPIAPRTYQAMLGRGMDVDWMKTAARRRLFSPRIPADFAARGIEHVRIRVRDGADPVLLDPLERAVQASLDAGLIPVIAYQAAAFKKAPTPETMAEFVHWWQVVAARFADAPPELAFDLIIEVTDALKHEPALLNQAYAAAVAAIRETNPTRIVIISPVLRSAPEKLGLLRIPPRADGYLLAEWHFYASGPSPTNPKKLWTTGTQPERALIEAKVAAARAWQDATGVPTWVGAWMAGNYNKGNDYSVAEQVAFAAFVTCLLERAAIPSAINASNWFYDDGANAWNPALAPVLDAYLAGCPQD